MWQRVNEMVAITRVRGAVDGPEALTSPGEQFNTCEMLSFCRVSVSIATLQSLRYRPGMTSTHFCQPRQMLQAYGTGGGHAQQNALANKHANGTGN